MNYQLKKEIEDFYVLCDTIGQMEVWRPPLEITLRDCAKMELAYFLMYISRADGEISEKELEFIIEYLDLPAVPEVLRNIDKDNYTEESIPVTLTFFIDFDNFRYSKTKSNDMLASELYYELMVKCGMEFIACDNEISQAEVEALTINLNKIKDCIRETIISQNIGRTNIMKPDSKSNEIKIDIQNKEETLEELLEELNSLTGLKAVKSDVNSLVNLIQIRKIREERGMKTSPMSLHLVFSGNPGTGKTTVARLLAQIYHQLGILSKGQLVEVDRSGLVGGYVGQTALKVQEVVNKSIGGVLFIDEAYSLTSNKSQNDYGQEAVDTLLKAMEDNRNDLIVIVAGYPELMEEFLNSNPGLRSRFNKFIYFEDYKPEELVDIFKGMCEKEGYNITKSCHEYIKKYFEERYNSRKENYANGRDVRNFFEIAMVNQANRLSTIKNISNDELIEFELSDVENIVI